MQHDNEPERPPTGNWVLLTPERRQEIEGNAQREAHARLAALLAAQWHRTLDVPAESPYWELPATVRAHAIEWMRSAHAEVAAEAHRQVDARLNESAAVLAARIERDHTGAPQH